MVGVAGWQTGVAGCTLVQGVVYVLYVSRFFQTTITGILFGLQSSIVQEAKRRTIAVANTQYGSKY